MLSLIRNLETFIKIRVKSQGGNDFDEKVKSIDEKILNSNLDPKNREMVEKLFQLYRKYFYMYLVINLKLIEIGKGLIEAYKNGNPTVHISLTRAFIEHTASLAYLTKLINSCANNLQKISNEKMLNSVYDDHSKKLHKFFYGSTSEKKNEGFIHVNDMIDELKKHIEGIKNDYNSLCDFVHPNYGSYKLVSSGILGKGKLFAEDEIIQHEQDLANKSVTQCTNAIENMDKEFLKYLLDINKYINFTCLLPSKITQIFNKRHESIGRGNSKDDSVHFPHARTMTEELEAYYEYFTKRKRNIIRRETIELIDGYLYSKITTDRGIVYVKFKERDITDL